MLKKMMMIAKMKMTTMTATIMKMRTMTMKLMRLLTNHPIHPE